MVGSGQAMVGDREVEASNKRKQKDPPLPMYGLSYGYGTNLIAGGDIASHSGILMILETMIYSL
jgi:hypothetical protein